MADAGRAVREKASEFTMVAMAVVVECPKDPGVETALRCSRCDTPICPKCMIQTPVGARCRECARLAKSPIYVLKGQQLVLGIAAAVLGGVGIGLIWGAILWRFQFGFLSIFLGAALAWAFTRMMDAATQRKRGPVVTGLAMGGIALAWGVQFAFVGWDIAAWGLLAAGLGAYLAYQNLR